MSLWLPRDPGTLYIYIVYTIVILLFTRTGFDGDFSRSNCNLSLIRNGPAATFSLYLIQQSKQQRPFLRNLLQSHPRTRIKVPIYTYIFIYLFIFLFLYTQRQTTIVYNSILSLWFYLMLARPIYETTTQLFTFDYQTFSLSSTLLRLFNSILS